MAIGPAQEALAIDLLGFEGAGMAVEEADRFHAALVRAGLANSQGRGAETGHFPGKVGWLEGISISVGRGSVLGSRQ